MTLRFSAVAWTAMRQVVDAGGRVEVCGALLARADDDDAVVHIVALPNVAAAPARRFAVDDGALLATLRGAAERGQVLRGIFHTHVDGDACLSPDDVDGALWDGAPRFPGASLVVIATRVGAFARVESFRWSAAQRAFVPERVDLDR